MHLKAYLEIDPDDAIVLVADTLENASDALSAVLDRAKQAVTHIPNETRGVFPDGLTHYLRPRPGAARMYPETDVPPVPITKDHLKRLKANLPESPEIKRAHLMKKYRLNKKLASQILDSDYSDVFETVATTTSMSPSFIAATVTETFKSLQREGIDVSVLSDETIQDLFSFVASGNVAKEAIPELLVWMVKHETTTLEDAAQALGLKMIPELKLKEIVDRVVRENEALILERKGAALGPLMGMLMRDLRGKADAEKISQLVKNGIDQTLTQ